MAEELALDEFGGDGGAVDRDERVISALALLVDRPRDQLLAGPALAGDEDIGLGPRHLPDHLVDVLHRRAVADDHREVQAAPELPFELLLLVLDRPQPDGLGQRLQQFVLVEGLGNEVVGPLVHGLTAVSVDAKAEIMITTGSGGCRLQARRTSTTRDVPQAHVAQQQVVAALLDQRHRPAAVFGAGHLVPFALKHVLEQLAHAELVVGNQDVGAVGVHTVSVTPRLSARKLMNS